VQSKILKIGSAGNPSFDDLKRIAASDGDGDDTVATNVTIEYKPGNRGGRKTHRVVITDVTESGRLTVETMRGDPIGSISRKGRNLFLNH